MMTSAAAILGATICACLLSSSMALQWAGRSWTIRTSNGLEGPGPNYFSDANVNIDSSGNLQLQIQKQKNKWTCAEVFLTNSLGYGTYTWTISSGATSLANNVVLGLFTYDNDPEQAHREIDVEFARWGATPSQDPSNAQWVVQPYDSSNHLQRWLAPSSTPLVVSFKWTDGQIYWEGRQNGNLISSKTYTGSDVPTPGAELVHMNLWVFQQNSQGAGPTNGKTATVSLSNFAFSPA